MDQREQKTGFPRAILHVDGDSFFVSCELSRRPGLRARAVVTGEERGIATALNPAAKALGVVRGMRTHDIRRNFPQVVILPSDYRMYAQYAQRMYAIVRRRAGEDKVEEYSIDECFADVTQAAQKGGVEAVARAIQDDLHAYLGVSFSVGVGVNKVTAKIASKWDKPRGLTLMPQEAIPGFLAKLPIGKVWGIGSATTVKLRKLGIATALDLYGKDRAWVAEHCDKPLAEIYEELHGAYVKELEVDGRDPSSVQRTRTFHPAVGADQAGRAFLWSQISYHAEDACARLRGKGLVARRAGIFLKTQEFQYLRGEAILPDPSAAPEEILRAVEPEFELMWRKIYRGEAHAGRRNTLLLESEIAEGCPIPASESPHKVLFRAAGISLGGLTSADAGSGQLFGASVRTKASRAIHATIDRLARKFGKHSVFLGSSFAAMKHDGDFDEPTGKDRSWDVIYLGEVA